MDQRGDHEGARYGIDIRPARWHIEAEDLAQIPPALMGHTGRVTVMDRASESVAFEGSAEEVRAAITLLTASLQARTNGVTSRSRTPGEYVSSIGPQLGVVDHTSRSSATSRLSDSMKWLAAGKTASSLARNGPEAVRPTPIPASRQGDTLKPQKPSINYRVVPFAPGQTAPTRELSRLHREILPSSPAVLMGRHFLESFFYTVLPREGYIEGAVAYVDDTPAGFLVFTRDSDRFMGRAAVRHAPRLASALAADTLTNPLTLKHVFDSWRLMRSRTTSGEPIAEIMSVGVQPFCRGHDFKARTGIHVARSLHAFALERLRGIGARFVRTVVNEDNDRSIQYHLKTGWKIFATGLPGRNVPSIEFRIRPEDFCAQ